jgi:hypothetical protein
MGESLFIWNGLFIQGKIVTVNVDFITIHLNSIHKLNFLSDHGACFLTTSLLNVVT